MSIQALAHVLEQCDAQHGARCVMFAIANHADERGENCWASTSTLAHEARLSPRRTQEVLADLREAGEIEAVGASRRQTTVYRIVGMAASVDQVLQGDADIADPPGNSRGGAPRDYVPTPARVADKPSRTVLEPEREKYEKEKEAERRQFRRRRVAAELEDARATLAANPRHSKSLTPGVAALEAELAELEAAA